MPLPALFDTIARLDAAARAWMTTHHAPLLDTLMLWLSAVGRRGAIWLALGTGLALVRPRRAGRVLRLALAIALAIFLTDWVIKPTLGRGRPFSAAIDVRVIGDRPETFSFPSGHAATAFAGAYGLARAWPQGRVAWWTLAFLIAYSRVYVGVHYPLDVMGGAFLGLACGFFAIGPRPERPRGGAAR